MPVNRMRLTIHSQGERTEELRIAAALRRDIWAHSPVEIDPDNPLHGTHRDEDGRAYFEFVTEYPDEVRRVLEDSEYVGRVDLFESPSVPGEECANCGNIAGPVLPAICPNCGFRDISDCPNCGRAIPRQRYCRLEHGSFRCPECSADVLLRFNEPMFQTDGSYNSPLVIAESAVPVQ